jgi:hypothetical protein
MRTSASSTTRSCADIDAGSGGEHPDRLPDQFDGVDTAQLVWILASRLPEPEGMAQPDD